LPFTVSKFLLIRSLVTYYNMSWFKSNFGWMVYKVGSQAIELPKRLHFLSGSIQKYQTQEV
ncbi:unnamed protein product, partial [Prunus brigantina]